MDKLSSNLIKPPKLLLQSIQILWEKIHKGDKPDMMTTLGGVPSGLRGPILYPTEKVYVKVDSETQ